MRKPFLIYLYIDIDIEIYINYFSGNQNIGQSQTLLSLKCMTDTNVFEENT